MGVDCLRALGRAALLTAFALAAPLAAAQTDRLNDAATFDAVDVERAAFHADRDVPQFLAGDLGAVSPSADAAVAFYRENAALFGFAADPDVRATRVETDALGRTHVFVQQTVNGVPVWGAESALHVDADGQAYAWGGDLYPAAQAVATTPAFRDAAAIDAAQRALGPVEYRQSEAPSVLRGDVPDWSPQAELVVFPHEGAFALAYHVRLFVESPTPANWEVFVDATTGAEIHRFNSLHTFDPRAEAASHGPLARPATALASVMDGPTTGSGTSLFGGTLSLPTYLYNGAYYLYDTTRGPSYIRTMSANNGTGLPGSYVTDANNAFTAQSQKAAVDAHYGAVTTFDYFKGTHGRNSYNGSNATITSTVNYSSNYNNAFWNGQQMVYGDGDGNTFIALVSLDIAAHELTHAVTGASAGLIYQNESGALNEAVSDIMAVMVDRDDWKVGEDAYTPGTSGDALRYMDNPPAGNQPDNYADRYTGSQDNGGVHINSGIANKQAYLMSVGGTFRGVAVQAVGRSVTEKVWYRALVNYFTQSTNFAGAREGTLQAAADLYGSGSAQYNAVADAWAAVGVGSASGGGGGGGDTGGGTPEWRYETVTIQSPHNYPNNYNDTKTYSKPGAQRVAMYFERFDTETNYDYVYIKDENNTTQASYTGRRSAFWAVVDGASISANLVTDYSVRRYGYRVTRVAYFSDRSLFAGGGDEGEPLGYVPEAAASDAVSALAKAGDDLALAVGPNPVRGAAVATLDLPEAGPVRVAVLDLLGRQVALAHEGALDAGRQTVALPTGGLPAGVYVVVADVAGQRMTQQLSVVR